MKIGEINTKRFFEDTDLHNYISLTQDEAYALVCFEIREEVNSGVSMISGGFARVILKEIDEDNTNIILGIIKSGVQSDCENKVYTDSIKFDRKSKKSYYV